jgi:hypothetical protein
MPVTEQTIMPIMSPPTTNSPTSSPESLDIDSTGNRGPIR